MAKPCIPITSGQHLLLLHDRLTALRSQATQTPHLVEPHALVKTSLYRFLKLGDFELDTMQPPRSFGPEAEQDPLSLLDQWRNRTNGSSNSGLRSGQH